MAATTALPPKGLFDRRNRIAAIQDAEFQNRVRSRVDYVKASEGAGSWYPPDGAPIVLRPIDWDIKPSGGKDGREVFGDTYKVAMIVADPQSTDNGKQVIYSFDCPKPKKDEDPTKSKFRSGIAGIRRLLRAVTPNTEDGSDPTEDETNWIPDPRNPTKDPGILEMMCEAGRQGQLLIRATPMSKVRVVPASKGKPERSFTEHYLTAISEYNPALDQTAVSDDDGGTADDAPIEEPEEAPAPKRRSA